MLRPPVTTFVTLIFVIGLGTDTASAQKIYWADFRADKIQRANLDGSNVEDLVTSGLVFPSGIALDPIAGKMYWTSQGTSEPGKILRANLDGSNVENVVPEGLDHPAGITLDLDAGRMYWVDIAGNCKIRRANLDGSGMEDLVIYPYSDTPLGGIALDPDAGKMYVTIISDYSYSGMIERYNLDGSGWERLIFDLAYPQGIALDLGARKMYWTNTDYNFGTAKIQRADLDGSNIEDVVSVGLVDVYGVALDLEHGEIYWSERGIWNQIDGKIMRAELGGSNVEELVTTGINEPAGIALHLQAPVSTLIQDFSSCWTGRHVEVSWRLVPVVGTLSFDISRKVLPHGAFKPIQDAEVGRWRQGYVFEDQSTGPGKMYRYRVVIVKDGQPVTSFETEVATPWAGFVLQPNVPNPFNPMTRIDFSVDRKRRVALAIYDLAGRLVKTLVDEPRGAGAHSVTWDGRDGRGTPAAGGIYMVQLKADGRALRQKAVFLK
jgi:sugar lactone lactonase YvrE